MKVFITIIEGYDMDKRSLLFKEIVGTRPTREMAEQLGKDKFGDVVFDKRFIRVPKSYIPGESSESTDIFRAVGDASGMRTTFCIRIVESEM